MQKEKFLERLENFSFLRVNQNLDNEDIIVIESGIGKKSIHDVFNQVYKMIEKNGLENEINLHFSDEIIDCNECYKSIYIYSDYYSIKYYIINDCELLCPECFENYILNLSLDELKECEFSNNFKKALDESIIEKLIESEKIKLIENDFDNGFYSGHNDQPEKILEDLLKENKDKYYLFSVDAISQFNVNFSIYQIL